MAARERRVALHEIGAYRGNPDTAAPGRLAMGFGNVKEGAIESAIADLLAGEEATAPGTEPLCRHEIAIGMGLQPSV
jgi:hypothetical protein